MTIFNTSFYGLIGLKNFSLVHEIFLRKKVFLALFTRNSKEFQIVFHHHHWLWRNLYFCMLWSRLKNIRRPRVNFINILRKVFMLVGPKSVKQHCCLDCLFALLKSACVKAACRTLMKFTSSTISQNFVCQAKRRRLTEFAKKIAFQFHQHSATLK